jgi:hypothetical protein
MARDARRVDHHQQLRMQDASLAHAQSLGRVNSQFCGRARLGAARLSTLTTYLLECKPPSTTSPSTSKPFPYLLPLFLPTRRALAHRRPGSRIRRRACSRRTLISIPNAGFTLSVTVTAPCVHLGPHPPNSAPLAFSNIPKRRLAGFNSKNISSVVHTSHDHSPTQLKSNWYRSPLRPLKSPVTVTGGYVVQVEPGAVCLVNATPFVGASCLRIISLDRLTISSIRWLRVINITTQGTLYVRINIHFRPLIPTRCQVLNIITCVTVRYAVSLIRSIYIDMV